MSWESTARYYQWLNEGVREKLGGLHSARIVMSSVNFAEIQNLQAAARWEEAGGILMREAGRLESAGADFILLATNTMHKVAAQIRSAIRIPFVHIGDTTAGRIRTAGLKKVGLLATVYTMEQDFYKARLENSGLEVLVPGEADRRKINAVIFEELCRGQKKACSREFFLRVANDLFGQGAEGVILGCTEINMLITQDDFAQPVFDTTRIHIEEALAMALPAA